MENVNFHPCGTKKTEVTEFLDGAWFPHTVSNIILNVSVMMFLDEIYI